MFRLISFFQRQIHRQEPCYIQDDLLRDIGLTRTSVQFE